MTRSPSFVVPTATIIVCSGSAWVGYVHNQSLLQKAFNNFLADALWYDSSVELYLSRLSSARPTQLSVTMRAPVEFGYFPGARYQL